MKSLYILFFVALASFQVSGQTAEKIKWHTMEEALTLNAASPRKILLDVYTDWCGFCKRMDAETFNHPTIAKYINQNFYAVKFNAESSTPIIYDGHTYTNPGNGGMRRSTDHFDRALGVSGYPTIAYINSDLKIIGIVPGFYTAVNIEPLLHFIAEEKYLTIGFEEYEKTFQGELNKK